MEDERDREVRWIDDNLVVFDRDFCFRFEYNRCICV